MSHTGGRYKVQQGGLYKVQRGGVYRVQGFENFSEKGRLYDTTEFFQQFFEFLLADAKNF